MNEAEESWTDWIEHDGQPRPELNGRLMRVQTEIGDDEIGIMQGAHFPPDGLYSSFVWASLPVCYWPARIIRYQLHQPRALQKLITLVETLPALGPRVTEPA
jgi:hypothetical protein